MPNTGRLQPSMLSKRRSTWGGEQAIQDIDRRLRVLLDKVLTGEFAKSIVEGEQALIESRADSRFEGERLSERNSKAR